MNNIEDTVWEHLVEHHGADRARMRTTTQSRTPKRPVVVGIAATGLAAAAVATVLVTSSGSAPTAGGGPSTASGPATAQDTAYIVKRVNARIADDPSAAVYRTYQDPDARETTNGSLVNLGHERFSTYTYLATDGVHYDRVVSSSTGITSSFTDYPAVQGKATSVEVDIDSAKRTYSTQRWTNPVPAGYKVQGVPSDVSEVRRALKSGTLSKIGTTVIDGTRTIALSMTKSHGYTVTLYVDARTYQPLRQVDANPDHNSHYFNGLYITDWLPASPANVATAEKNSIPAGYTRVANIR